MDWLCGCFFLHFTGCQLSHLRKGKWWRDSNSQHLSNEFSHKTCCCCCNDDLSVSLVSWGGCKKKHTSSISIHFIKVLRFFFFQVYLSVCSAASVRKLLLVQNAFWQPQKTSEIQLFKLKMLPRIFSSSLSYQYSGPIKHQCCFFLRTFCINISNTQQD